MFSLYDIRKEYERLDKITGLNISRDVELSLTSRCTRRRGVYKRRSKNGVLQYEKIVISNFVLSEPPESFFDTIRHEYAHAMDMKLNGPYNTSHSESWKRCCEIVGCVPSATTEASDAQVEYRKSKGYTLCCQTCGHEWNYQRMSKTLKAIMGGIKYECPYCNGKNLSVTANQK